MTPSEFFLEGKAAVGIAGFTFDFAVSIAVANSGFAVALSSKVDLWIAVASFSGTVSSEDGLNVTAAIDVNFLGVLMLSGSFRAVLPNTGRIEDAVLDMRAQATICLFGFQLADLDVGASFAGGQLGLWLDLAMDIFGFTIEGRLTYHSTSNALVAEAKINLPAPIHEKQLRISFGGPTQAAGRRRMSTTSCQPFELSLPSTQLGPLSFDATLRISPSELFFSGSVAICDVASVTLQGGWSSGSGFEARAELTIASLLGFSDIAASFIYVQGEDLAYGLTFVLPSDLCPSPSSSCTVKLGNTPARRKARAMAALPATAGVRHGRPEQRFRSHHSRRTRAGSPVDADMLVAAEPTFYIVDVTVYEPNAPTRAGVNHTFIEVEHGTLREAGLRASLSREEAQLKRAPGENSRLTEAPPGRQISECEPLEFKASYEIDISGVLTVNAAFELSATRIMVQGGANLLGLMANFTGDWTPTRLSMHASVGLDKFEIKIGSLSLAFITATLDMTINTNPPPEGAYLAVTGTVGLEWGSSIFFSGGTQVSGPEFRVISKADGSTAVVLSFGVGAPPAPRPLPNSTCGRAKTCPCRVQISRGSASAPSKYQLVSS